MPNEKLLFGMIGLHPIYHRQLLSSGNPMRIFDATFYIFTLREWCIEHDCLQPTRHISVEEQLAIFLKIVGENASNGTGTFSAERFDNQPCVQQSPRRDYDALTYNCHAKIWIMDRAVAR